MNLKKFYTKELAFNKCLFQNNNFKVFGRIDSNQVIYFFTDKKLILSDTIKVLDKKNQDITSIYQKEIENYNSIQNNIVLTMLIKKVKGN